jgi:hypothetical protein
MTHIIKEKYRGLKTKNIEEVSLRIGMNGTYGN